MNIANRITVTRFFLTILLIALLAWLAGPGWLGAPPAWVAWAALVVFAVAASSDALDGYLARKHGIVTPFGRILDPLVDKMLITGTMIMLAALPETGAILRAWMVVVIVGREFLVTGIRGWMESEGVNFQADASGKLKMVLQTATLVGLLLYLALDASPAWLGSLCLLLVWATILVTLYSGGHYLRRFVEGARALDLDGDFM